MLIITDWEYHDQYLSSTRKWQRSWRNKGVVSNLQACKLENFKKQNDMGMRVHTHTDLTHAHS